MNRIATFTPNPLLSFAIELSKSPSENIRSKYQNCTTLLKVDNTFVTDADRLAEELMRGLIADRYPTHGIIGEEGGEKVGTDNFQWVLDPIDGTSSFVIGVPKFGTLIALLESGIPILGVIHLPVTNETLYAEKGMGCWYSRGTSPPRRVHVNKHVLSLRDATVSLSGVDCSELRDGMQPNVLHLGGVIKKAGSLEFIGDCIQHMLVAKGNLHVALDSIMHPWDSAAIIPCITEAGGIVSTVQGSYENVVLGGSLISSCSMKLHEEVLKIINGKVMK